jgi:hypothetical protein
MTFYWPELEWIETAPVCNLSPFVLSESKGSEKMFRLTSGYSG